MVSSTGIFFLILGLLNSTLILASVNLYSFKVKDIRGTLVDLGQYGGKVTLVVNTASQCSLTDSNFKSLKRLHDILSFGDKFNVIVFPSNDFGDQEPWDEPEIEEYIRGHFKGEFPIMAKSHVIGEEASDLWKWVAETSAAPTWNFDKYLINHEGIIVNHWSAKTTVESIFNEIQSLVDGTDYIHSEARKPGIQDGSDTKGENEEADQRKDEL